MVLFDPTEPPTPYVLAEVRIDDYQIRFPIGLKPPFDGLIYLWSDGLITWIETRSDLA